MFSHIFWEIVFFILLMGLLYPNVRPKHAVIPILWPVAYCMCEVNVFTWLWRGGWNGMSRWIWLVSFLLVGCVLLQQLFGQRRWYIFYGGGFQLHRESYDMLAQKISQFLWLQGLSPADVLLRYEGLLGLAPVDEEAERALLKEIDEVLEDTQWRKWSLWQTLFVFQGLLMIILLGIHILYVMGVWG